MLERRRRRAEEDQGRGDAEVSGRSTTAFEEIVGTIGVARGGHLGKARKEGTRWLAGSCRDKDAADVG